MVSNSPSRMAIILLDFPGVDFTSQPKRAGSAPCARGLTISAVILLCWIAKN